MVRYQEKIQQFLHKESRWTKGVAARDIYGNPVELKSYKAVCWCLGAAIIDQHPRVSDPQCMGYYQDVVVKKTLEAIKQFFPERIPYGPYTDISIIAYFNDNPNTTFSDIRRVIEHAEI